MYFNQPCPCKRSDSSSDHQNAIFHNGVLLLRKRTLKQWFQLLFKLSSCEGTQVISTLVRFHKPPDKELRKTRWRGKEHNSQMCFIFCAKLFIWTEIFSLRCFLSVRLERFFWNFFYGDRCQKGIGTGRRGRNHLDTNKELEIQPIVFLVMFSNSLHCQCQCFYDCFFFKKEKLERTMWSQHIRPFNLRFEFSPVL